MKARSAVVALAILVVVAGCAALKAGRAFPSPDPAQITANVTDKAALERMLGAPYQVGLDSGDQTWRWFYAEHGSDEEVSKDLTVRFNANGTVKSYSFTSNFPEDMRKYRR
jgi:hypothetical protein